MTERTSCYRLQVATVLYRFIEDQVLVLPGTGINSESFWAGLDAIVHDLTPKNISFVGRARSSSKFAGSMALSQPGANQ
ncbi:MAG: hypothetical protein WDM70_08075 [Nitrosomonadales bacterium]